MPMGTINNPLATVVICTYGRFTVITNMIHRAYKFKLYPTKEQLQQLAQCGGNTRFLWNHFLTISRDYYQQTKKFMFHTELSGLIPGLKQIYPFLTIGWAQSLQQVARRFDRALKDCVNQASDKKFPVPKRKSNHNDSFTIPQKFRVNKNYVHIPKVGDIKWIKHQAIKGKIKHITIKQDGTHWYCSVNVELKTKVKTAVRLTEDQIVGIDVGLKTYATLSDNSEPIQNPRLTKKYERRLRRANRRLHRKTKGGKNRLKQKQKVQQIHRKIRCCRRDFQHKTTHHMITKYDGFILESLNIKGMTQNHTLAKAVSDAAWYEFVRQLKYKADWSGKLFHQIDRWEPTSKTCHQCGWIDHNLKLNHRTFRCQSCGLVMDRDLNAAINIKIVGIKELTELGLLYRGAHGNSTDVTLGEMGDYRPSGQCSSWNQEKEGCGPIRSQFPIDTSEAIKSIATQKNFNVPSVFRPWYPSDPLS